VLELLRRGPDPTVRLEIRAGAPADPVGPGLPLAVMAGALIGLLLGLAAAFAIRSLDPTLRRESQLREHYRLPIFARIATQPGGHDAPLTPAALSAGAQEAYRSLRTLMFSRAGKKPQVMLITSPSPGDGKSTTALNLALSFAASAQSVLLIEADLRRPSLARALGVDVPASLSDVLLGKASFDHAVQTVDAYGPSVSFLLGDPKRPQVLEILGVAAVDDLLNEARARYDAVIIDSPPATAVADALPLAQKADAVLLVVRVGKTRLPALARLGELLNQHGIVPIGLTVNGVDDSGTSSEYEYYARPAQSGATAS
jgi:capsular exopolysaccharide synthesis family protein